MPHIFGTTSYPDSVCIAGSQGIDALCLLTLP